MSRDDNDLQVPDLGPADPSVVKTPQGKPLDKVEPVSEAGQTTQNTRPEQSTSGVKSTPNELVIRQESSGDWFVTLILVLLTAAASGLGYMMFGLQQTIEQQRTDLQASAERIQTLEKLLNVTAGAPNPQALTLEERLSKLDATMLERHKHFDAEIAGLWKLTESQQKSQLESLSGSLKTLQAQVEGLIKDQKTGAAQINQVEEKLVSLDKRLASNNVASEVEALKKQQAQADKRLTDLQSAQKTAVAKQASTATEQNKQLDSLQQSLSTLRTQLAILEESLAEGQAQLQSGLAKQSSRIASLEKANRSGGGALSSRVQTNEQAIRAIDGTRRQMVGDIQALKQKLNALQLQVNRL